MKKIGKVILALALCLSIFAGNSGMVLADELHKHCVCATSSCSETEHNGETEWTAWTSQDSLPTDSGYYYLTQDVNIRDGSNVTLYNNIHLCLNGHSITGSYGDNLIYVSGGTAFTITDCQNTAGSIINNINKVIGIAQGGTLNLYKGNLTSARAAATETYGSLNQYGGIIQGFDYGARAYAGVYAMYGGMVRNTNTTTVEYPVNVSKGAAFYLYDGTVEGKSGGLSSHGTSYIYGGMIKGSWGAIYCAGTCYLEGGELTATGSGVVLEGTLYIKNSPAINGATSDINLKKGRLIELTGPLTGTSTYTVEVSNEEYKEKPFTNAWTTYMAGADEGQYFTSADSFYRVVKTDSGELALAEAVKVVEDMIAALPEADDFVVEDKDDVKEVKAVKEAYDALTEEQKESVDEELVSKLEELLDAIESFENVQKVKDMITALPEAEDVDLDDKEAAEQAKEAYDALTESEKAMIDEDLQAKLNAVIDAIEELEKANDTAEDKKDTEDNKDTTGDKDMTDKNAETPKTGDNTQMYIYLTLFLVSAAAVAGAVILKKKRA